MNSITFVGLDVHKETITIAIAKTEGFYHEIGTIENEPKAIAKMVKKLGAPESLFFCYEAGACGYTIHRQLTDLGAKCVVVAPSLIPKAPGDRIKTDRRDAMKLAKMLMWNQLQPVWVPDEEHEAFRQLVRAREIAQEDVTRKKNQITKMLLLHGEKPPTGAKLWNKEYRRWVVKVKFKVSYLDVVFGDYLNTLQEAEDRVERLEKLIEEVSKESKLAPLIAALQGLRGVALVTACTIVTEAGDMSRFDSPTKFMSYAGLIPSEYSSGRNVQRGRITKAGNHHLRRIIVESAWHYRHSPRIGEVLKKRQRGLTEEVKQIAWKAQQRLTKKFRKDIGRGKNSNVAAVAVARELLGFMWAIAKQVNQPNLIAA